MPVPALIAAAPAIIQGAKSIADIFGGGSDYEKAKAEQDKLKRPFYEIQKEYEQNRNIAANQASQGMGSAAKDYYTTEAQRGLGTSIGAIEQSGGNPNDVSAILDTYMRSIGQTAAQDSMMHTQNIGEYMKRNSELAGQKTIQWQLNKMNPYQDAMAYTSQQMGLAKQKQNAGWSGLVGAGQAAVTSMQNQDLANAARGNTPPQSNAPQMVGNMPMPQAARGYQEPVLQAPPEFQQQQQGQPSWIPAANGQPYVQPNNNILNPNYNIWQ